MQHVAEAANDARRAARVAENHAKHHATEAFEHCKQACARAEQTVKVGCVAFRHISEAKDDAENTKKQLQEALREGSIECKRKRS